MEQKNFLYLFLFLILIACETGTKEVEKPNALKKQINEKLVLKNAQLKTQ